MKRYVARLVLLLLQLGSFNAMSLGQPPGTVIAEVPNPEPMSFATFGATTQVLGNGFAVGALGVKDGPFYEGAVYLFDAAGQPTHELHRPVLEDTDRFGHALANSDNLLAVADPRFNIGSNFSAGAIHIFNSDSGQYVRSIFNPSPADHDLFGWDVTTSGTTLIVSELSETIKDPNVYLYSIETGNLIRTIQKPSNATQFGTAVAVAGNQVFVSGMMGQVAALFSFDTSTGQPIHTFVDPTPDQNFSSAVQLVAVGDRLVVGGFSPEVYVIDVPTGDLLKTITDPGNNNGTFGTSLAAYGKDILISSQSGPKAYVIDPNTGDNLLSVDVPHASNFPALVGAYLSLSDLNGDILVGNPAWRKTGGGFSDEGRIFIVQGIPEPSTAALLVIGGVVALAVRRPVTTRTLRIPSVSTETSEIIKRTGAVARTKDSVQLGLGAYRSIASFRGGYPKINIVAKKLAENARILPSAKTAPEAAERKMINKMAFMISYAPL